MQTKNIISIRKNNAELASKEFNKFMTLTESELNSKAIQYPNSFRTLNASQLENVVVKCMKEISCATPFDANEIKLISGLSFPDIIAETYYGVEVKSTQSDHWKSTGSSIIETTRNKNVEDIYLLFGKLGGQPQFKCKPYEDCLYDITVTHSPRYLIDMCIDKDQTIFAKMQTTYDNLRTSKDSIAQVRRYYRDKTKQEKKGEMPWWLEDLNDKPKNDLLNKSNQLMIRHFSALDKAEKQIIITQLYILFPSYMIDGKYMEPAMWLVAYHKVVSHNMRDYFSAGGQIKFINGKKLNTPIPAIIKRFLDFAPMVKKNIPFLDAEIDIYNPTLLDSPQGSYWAWIEQIDCLFKAKYGNQIHFKEWVENDDKLSI